MSNTVTQEQVNDFMASANMRDECWWGNTTIVSMKFSNGWIITETSSCVDAANYDHQLGVEICKGRIETEVWKLLGWDLNQKLLRK